MPRFCTLAKPSWRNFWLTHTILSLNTDILTQNCLNWYIFSWKFKFQPQIPKFWRKMVFFLHIFSYKTKNLTNVYLETKILILKSRNSTKKLAFLTNFYLKTKISTSQNQKFDLKNQNVDKCWPKNTILTLKTEIVFYFDKFLTQNTKITIKLKFCP